MKDATLLFLYPSRSRPQKFAEGLKSIKDNLARLELAEFVFTIDSDDPKVNEYIEICKANNVVFYGGESKTKIAAVNRGMKHAPEKWDILVVMSDDMRFIEGGFDETIREDFEANFPDGDGVLHYNDGVQFSNCMTMSIMGRKYYERRNYVYHESYESICCDLEAQNEAKMLGKYKYMGDNVNIVKHLHPSFGLSEYDEQYRKTEAFEVHERDKANYAKRETENFGLFMSTTGGLKSWNTSPMVATPMEFIPLTSHEEMISGYKEKVTGILKNALQEIERIEG
jgi:hypothetical protein